jgi:hypothetical protein
MHKNNTLDLRPFFIERGSTVRVRQRALQKRRKRALFVYIDAHADFAARAESPSHSACSMNLALATGRAGGPLSHLAGDAPLVGGKQVVHIGRRDDDQPAYGWEALAPSGILDLSRERGSRARRSRAQPRQHSTESGDSPPASGPPSMSTSSTPRSCRPSTRQFRVVLTSIRQRSCSPGCCAIRMRSACR